ncbi:MAG: type II toxin-antitoxin system PemK/MazF family toxin [Candidatus Magasanikbacteria bacterium CG_4_10_14_0_2_um_filter_33_14]|uniref:mRNA interferase n=1 Tax=Candidatus Magasanikbacteria bacterium CG_4_10_14_0_2_um_filter_33_14 TaxID=1974636 RepID=A0A2M7VC96_9BACT|nr:MAG: type II toxin-antitoxin system PemK/MazF family toxin [Candidatus Magasanikbacteria bacterium CG_4_10_14_0_2_um_filter_33_14]
MKQGEIWLVDFPEGEGHEFYKERPALIIESDKQIVKSSIVTIMPITSNINNQVEYDLFLIRNNYNNLNRDSVLKCYDITGFDKTRFLKKIGKVKVDILEEVKDYLRLHFDL